MISRRFLIHSSIHSEISNLIEIHSERIYIEKPMRKKSPRHIKTLIKFNIVYIFTNLSFLYGLTDENSC